MLQALDGWIERVIASLRDMQMRLHDPEAMQEMLEDSFELREGWTQLEPNTRPGENAFHGDMQQVERMNLSGMLFGRRPSRRNAKSKS